MTGVLVDSNVLLDVLTDDPTWRGWSAGALDRCAREGPLCINAIIYAEISLGFHTIEELEAAILDAELRRLELPLEAAFLAGKAFVQYRRRGGLRTSTLPDFFVGAHAAVAGLQLLTRDERLYRSYFPSLTLISPSA